MTHRVNGTEKAQRLLGFQAGIPLADGLRSVVSGASKTNNMLWVTRLRECMALPITKPFFGPEELQAVQRPLETGWVVQGPYTQQFEDKFAAFTGSHGAVPRVHARRRCTSQSLC